MTTTFGDKKYDHCRLKLMAQRGLEQKKSRILISKREIETRTERRAEGKQRKWQNKMPNTTPREETASVGSRKVNVHFGEACAFKRDPKKKAKGRDDFVHLLRRVHCTEVRKVTDLALSWCLLVLWEPPWVNEKTPGEGTNAGFWV